jgi:peptidoglycan/xylan/chitin deacetylase (PgdA/CDA1 family)/uncharacterized membrane protein
MHAAGAIAALASAALFLVWPELWPWPLLAWLVLATAVAPYFPRWSFYLPVAARGSRERREVALTFDDGPDPRTLPHLLALLAAEGAPATFFVVGRQAEAHPEAVRALVAAGHELGNHSHTHDVFLALRGPARLHAEIERCQRAVAAAAGVRPLAYRPPVGITSPPLRGVLAALGLRCVAWSRRGLDFGNLRWRGLARRVLRGVRPGDVVLLHDRLPPAAPVEGWLAELRELLAGLRARGLRPVALSQLLGGPVMERIPARPDPSTSSGEGRVEDGSARSCFDRLSTNGSEAGTTEAPSAAPTPLERLSQLLLFLFTLAYPALVAVSLGFLGARTAALVLLGVHLAMRLGTLRRDLARGRGLVAVAATVAALLALGAILDDPRFLLAYPSLVSAALLAHFAWSLRTVPIAERFARMELGPGEELPPEGVRYCRRVTLAWCAFFAANGAVATALAIGAPRTVWAIYTGGVSYALIGLVFAVEYVVRRARFGRFGTGLVDRTLARLLSRTEGSP